MKNNAYEEMYLVENSHWWYMGLHDLVVHLINKLSEHNQLQIFDAGCGTGRLLTILSENGHDVAGLDYSEEALKYCSKRGLNNILKLDLNNWIPSPNTYDLITCFDVLCHKWIKDEIKILKTLGSGLKKDGLLFLNDPAFPTLSREHDQVVMIRERYTINSFRRVLASANLQPIIMTYRLPHAFLTLLALRYFNAIRKGENQTTSDIANIPPKLVNQFLFSLTQFENRLIGSGITMPFGSSLFTVAKKVGK